MIYNSIQKMLIKNINISLFKANVIKTPLNINDAILLATIFTNGQPLLTPTPPLSDENFIFMIDLVLLSRIKNTPFENKQLTNHKYLFHSPDTINIIDTFNNSCSYIKKSLFLETKDNEVTNEVINILTHKCKDSAIVGGFVRDSLCGIKNKDIDFVTKTSYDDLENIFKNEGFSVKNHGKHFLVLFVEKKGFSFEIANYRKDGTYIDGRRPEKVDIASCFEDANRRDFSINSLYWSLENEFILDFFDGLSDINNRTLKFIGKPEDRIKEDYLRVMRGYRFISKGFTAEKKTLNAMRNNFNFMISSTSSERIKNELEKIIGM
jgi:hypothetical protein